MEKTGFKHLCLLIVVACMIIGLGGWLDAAQIEPSYLEVKLDGTARPSGTFILSNVGDQEERYRINALHFEFSKKGVLSTSKTGDRSLAPWIRFNPREVTLPPGTRRTVRFMILPRGRLTQGEYWGAMELENLDTKLLVQGDPNADPNTDPTAETSVQVQVTSSLLVPIFGTVGTVDYRGELAAARVVSFAGKPNLQILFASQSTGRLGLLGRYRIEDESGGILAEDACAQGYVLPGRQRVFSHEIKADIPPGTYNLTIDANSLHIPEPLTLTQRIKWPPPELVVAPVKTQAKDANAPPPVSRQSAGAVTKKES